MFPVFDDLMMEILSTGFLYSKCDDHVRVMESFVVASSYT